MMPKQAWCVSSSIDVQQCGQTAWCMKSIFLWPYDVLQVPSSHRISPSSLEALQRPNSGSWLNSLSIIPTFLIYHPYTTNIWLWLTRFHDTAGQLHSKWVFRISSRFLNRLFSLLHHCCPSVVTRCLFDPFQDRSFLNSTVISIDDSSPTQRNLRWNTRKNPSAIGTPNRSPSKSRFIRASNLKAHAGFLVIWTRKRKKILHRGNMKYELC